MVASIRRIAALALVVSLLAGSVGCNTVEGFGEDLQALGGAMSNKAGGDDKGAEAKE